MNYEQLFELILELETLSDFEKSVIFDAFEDETFDEEMNDRLMDAIEEQMGIWEEQGVALEAELGEAEEVLQNMLQEIEEQHTSMLREAFKEFQERLKNTEAEIEGEFEGVQHESELNEADHIRSKLGLL